MLNRNTPEQELKNRFAQLCVDIIVMAQDLEESGDKIEPLSADLRAQVQQLGDASAELAAAIRLRREIRITVSNQIWRSSPAGLLPCPLLPSPNQRTAVGGFHYHQPHYDRHPATSARNDHRYRSEISNIMSGNTYISRWDRTAAKTRPCLVLAHRHRESRPVLAVG